MRSAAIKLIAFSVFAALLVVVTREGIPGDEVFSDGLEERSASTWNEAARFIWEDKGEQFTESQGSIRGAVVSPDNGDLYFARRDPGSWNLYRSRPRSFAGGYAEPEPVFELNSSRNDREPAFSADGSYLVFSSDRGGNYDLYLCEKTSDGFGPPRRIDGASSAGDERQPFFTATGEVFYFSVEGAAGNYRPRTLDIFLPDAVPVDEGTFWEDELEVRSAATDRDGRILLLAARPVGDVDFDLYRVVRHGDEFGRPKLLGTLSSDEDELDPRFSPSGSLFFSRSRPDSSGLDYSVHRADLRELDAMSIESAFWTMLVRILTALVALLIAGFLALRWKHLHPFFKFLLLSILVHLLLMLYVDPLGTGSTDEGGETISGFAVTYLQQNSTQAAFESAADSGSSRMETGDVAERVRPSSSKSKTSVDWEAQAFAADPAQTTRGEEVPAAAQASRSEAAQAGAETNINTPRLTNLADNRPQKLSGGATPVKARAVKSDIVASKTAEVVAHQPRMARERSDDSVRDFEVGRKSVVSTESEMRALRSSSAPSRANQDKRTVAIRSKATLEGAESRKKRADSLVASNRVTDALAKAGDKLGRQEKTTAFRSSRSAVEVSDLPTPTSMSRRRRSMREMAQPARRSFTRRSRSTDARATSAVARNSKNTGQKRRAAALKAPTQSAQNLTSDHLVAVVNPRRSPQAGSGIPEARILPRSFLASRAALKLIDKAPELPEALASRRGSAKALALKTGGGDEETEAAVLAGLRYLAGIQKNNGAWGSSRLDRKYGDRRLGKTGLALLAFLGSGYNQVDSSEFTDGVSRGIAFLLSQQDEETGHFGNCSAYGHGIATYALAEAYAMTKDASLRSPLRKGVRRIIRAQFESRRPQLDGGWGYYYRDPERRYDNWPRMSVTVWQVMALKSAKIGGLSVPSRVLDRARSYVLASRDSQLNALRYNQDPGWLRSGFPTLPGSSAAGLFAMQLFDVTESHPTYRTALNYVVQRPPRFRWRRASSNAFVNRGEGNLYFHYYAALALHRNGGSVWDRWNSQLKPVLLDNQESNGSWRPISQYNDYANESNQDRSYTTAMCVLMLEVYYRYFTPLTENHQRSGKDSGSEFIPDYGVEVSSVRARSSADDLGLRVGDRIIAVRGQPVSDTSDLRRQLRNWPRQEAGSVEIVRGGQKIVLKGDRRLGGFQALVD